MTAAAVPIRIPIMPLAFEISTGSASLSVKDNKAVCVNTNAISEADRFIILIA
jgi:hypothetical protein